MGLDASGGGSTMAVKICADGVGYLGEETQPATWCLLTPPPRRPLAQWPAGPRALPSTA